MKIKLYLCGNENPMSQYPLGLGYLKSNCSSPGVQIDIVNSPTELKDCDLIGLSSTVDSTKEVIDILNKQTLPVIIGGQVTLWKPLHNYGFKHIVIGEGETSLQQIIDGTSDKIIKYQQVSNINCLKYPERGTCREWIPMISSRGCPFTCKFCSSQQYWKKVRTHSPEYIAGEAVYISKRYPNASGIRIMDDLFAMNDARVDGIHKVWLKHNLQKRFKLHGFIRSSTFTKNMGLMLKEMGFTAVRFGAESGSDRLLKHIGKKATVADHQRAINIANSIGLKITATFMHGIPSETKEDVQLTKQFIEKNKGKLSINGWYKFRPFPGTDFYNGENPLTTDMKVRR